MSEDNLAKTSCTNSTQQPITPESLQSIMALAPKIPGPDCIIMFRSEYEEFKQAVVAAPDGPIRSLPDNIWPHNCMGINLYYVDTIEEAKELLIKMRVESPNLRIGSTIPELGEKSCG